MKLVRTTLTRPAPIDDSSMLFGQLAPGAWVVETGRKPPRAHDPARLPVWTQLSDGTALSLTSATALRLSVGTNLIEWLNQTGHPVGSLAGLALHELIVNAIIHGNLCVSHRPLDAWHDLDARQAMIKESLRNTLHANRLVTVALGWTSDRVLAVITDEGNGYEPAEPLSFDRASGRGLRIARAVGAVEILQGGRQALLTLACPPAQAGG